MCIILSLQAKVCILSFSLAQQLPWLYFIFSESQGLKNVDLEVGIFRL